jgi:NTP pyrophosphatase (non-canonical NTP hydrolase)
MFDSTATVAELRAIVGGFVREREWEIYHDAKNLSMALSIEAAELMEHFQWTRNDELGSLLADDSRRAAVAEELADVACFLLALCNVLKLDLSDALAKKMEKNRAKYPPEQFRGRYFKPGEGGS